MTIAISRRCLLAGTGGTLALTALPRMARAQAGIGAVPPAPKARVAPVSDTYFGETLVDPYRWMENDKDPAWLPFLRGQDAHTRAMLDRLPGRTALLARIRQLSGDVVSTADVQRAGGRIFFKQRPAGADNFKLFVREGGRTRTLVDPTAMSAAGAAHFSLDWWKASPDGTHVVYGVSKDGSEDSVLHVLTVADGRDLPETIANTQSAAPEWIEDGTGFFYTQLTGKVSTPERYLDGQARFHRLGADPAADPILIKRGLDPAVAYDRIQMPFIQTAPGSPYAMLILADVRPEYRLAVAPLADVLAGRARWTPVTSFEDEVTGSVLVGDDLYLLANKGSPRGRILRTSAAKPDLAGATELVRQGPQVIEEIARAKDALYLRIMDGGISRLRKLAFDGTVSEIALPFDGTIGALYAEPDEPGLLMSLSGWLAPTGIWSVDAAGRVADTGLTPRPPIDVSGYEAHRAFATARDGTKVPYTLIHKKGLKRDGTAPTYISAYGSYGAAAYTPAFQARQLALIDQGAVVGYANVRGGGEYGREWHQAGQHANKPNTWRDLIDVCQDVIAKGYTRPQHLAINGRSAGGITVGRALTERPDLFAAVVSGVGWSNPLRYVVEQNGFGEEPEWGAIGDPQGYRWLKAIDSYHAVKDGTRYPAVLLTTGVTDPRVAPFHVAKMAARLQAATSSGKPILLRVDFDAGHGIGSTRDQQDRETADTYAFVLWQTGARGPQPA
ncbi:prolyl oligopeptidase family serine peptidase [Sphingomonas sp.]|uniref:prolyl oligopeptidase family serine peptidase n=1 Tax=Sphingomonas sp. TaxID=28214 RepID=UPI003B3A54CC